MSVHREDVIRRQWERGAWKVDVLMATTVVVAM